MNLLANETSPYLRQHKDNPVHWMPWGAEAFEKAKALNKPILLSIGYAACHWCHVMAHESFEDGDTAALMNQHFINIKVDREERPDIDMIYQNALALMGQQGGWPLTMFMTPEREPFWGGTYFPPLPRHGLPGIREVLRGVNESWHQQQDKIVHNVKSLTTALHKLQERQEGHIVSREVLDKISLYFLSRMDEVNGGIGNAPKFPSLSIISLLWDAYIRTGGDAFKSAVIHSLTHMCQGGLYDHLGGGFCRYTVDAEWLVPHFEKMLYDNGLFLSILSEVYRETQNPLFAERIRETAAWLEREMAVAHNDATGFASSYDADSLATTGHAEEGAYYIWRAAEIDELLGSDSALFKRVYDITQGGNWEGVNIPNRLSHMAQLPPEEERKLIALRKRLKSSRDLRTPPARDDKVLADWNGLAISGLLRAHAALDMPELLKTAGNAFRFVTQNMMEPDGRLWHVFCDGKRAHAATLDDYANMSEAALLFFETTRNAAYLAQAETWAAIAMRDYWDNENKGFFLSSAQPDLLLRPKTADDTATPSGNGTMVGVLTRLYLVTGKNIYLDYAEGTARAFSGDIMQRFYPLSTYLANSDFLSHPASLVVVGKEGRAEMLAVLKTLSLPRLVVLETQDGNSLPQPHPAHGKTAFAGKAAAYVCFGRSCSAPVTDPASLRELLLQERARRRHEAANDG
ncbi:MAG: thioredoxin domain-containing protein [bacterium]|nr:thioredoxin domain-containing protein [bacterium]